MAQRRPPQERHQRGGRVARMEPVRAQGPGQHHRLAPAQCRQRLGVRAQGVAHAGGVFPRAVHRAQPRDARVDAVQVRQPQRRLLGRELGDAVERGRRRGRRRLVVARARRRRDAVDRDRADHQQPPHARARGGAALHQVHRAADVDVHHRAGLARLARGVGRDGGGVDHARDARVAQGRVHVGGRADVARRQHRARPGQAREHSGGRRVAVEQDDGLAAGHQAFGQRQPDEAAAAGDEGGHDGGSRGQRRTSMRRSRRATQRASGQSATKKITAAAISGVGL